MKTYKEVEILLVEDNPGDVRLTREALNVGRLLYHMDVVTDGVEALAYLRHEVPYTGSPLPDLILLDLNLPRMDGRELLGIIKSEPTIKCIPVVVLTTSKAEEDIIKSYNLHANCFITKPVDLDQFMAVIRSIEEFWFTIVRLPDKEKRE